MKSENESEKTETNSEVANPVDVLVIGEITQTCFACPSQWEATLSDGRMLYIRYRWGHLGVCVSKVPTDDGMEAVGGNRVFGAQLGDEFDGVIGIDEVKALTGQLIDYSACV